jgi:hypothetical protein
MRRPWILLMAVCLCLMAGSSVGGRGFALASGSAPSAPKGPDAGYEVSWWTSSDSSARFAGGSYAAPVTVGQAEASYWSGGAYTVRGGFWTGVPVVYVRYVPLILRGS